MSYRALLSIPSIRPFLAGMLIARIAQAMVSITIVLFTLEAYGSPLLSGLATFASIFPGLLVSPIAGALLDRHGRIRLVTLDYIVALLCLVSVGMIALLGVMTPWLLITIAAIASLTAPLSATGLRSLLPVIVPTHLWERVNAVDSTGYVLATIVGPPVAAMMVALLGGPATFIVIGATFGLAALVVAGLKEPQTKIASTGRLLADSWLGLVYTWRNRALRGLGFSVSAVNLANGAMTIIVPVLVLNHLRLNETTVGLVFALQGLAGVGAALVFGKMDTRNRERRMLVISMLLTGVAIVPLLLSSNLVTLIAVMALVGLLNGPLDIALFTLRQRCTDPAWTGRAFAVSMSFNYTGMPIGAAIAGALAISSLRAAILFSAIAALSAAALAATTIPQEGA
jgi:MFS family permease